MAVKHVILKSGERLIANVQEMVFEDKTVGYYLEKPCVVNIDYSKLKSGESNNKKTSFDVSLYPWIPFSKDTHIPTPLDWVVTIVEPVDMLLEMYKQNVLESNSEWNSGMNHSNVGDQNG
jgi:hypothetical protein